MSDLATKFGLGASNLDVPEARNSKMMLPGPKNVIKNQTSKISTKQNCLGMLYWDNYFLSYGLRLSRVIVIDRLRDMMERADVAVSEKFSQILRAYQIENEYGRTMEAYGDTINVEGAELKADVLKVGRVALVYQTPDGEVTGRWDADAQAWVELDDSYTTPVRNGIRMARKQLSVDMLPLPVRAPGGAD